ncbi:MAG TPA: CBS domain-containing protein [Bryobacteraceae bacterium]|nr:CBS domain-containing protein [Bryobacteraceae bacterium]
MAETLLYLTELLGLKVHDLKGRKIGVVKDAALVPLVHPARIDRFLVGGGWSWLTVRHDQVRSISLEGIYLKDELLTPYHSDEYMLRMVRDLLDQQIIDAQGRKVVRVTDVSFERHKENEHETLWVRDVDIGIRAVFRRVFKGLLPRAWLRRVQRAIPPHSIRWEFCNILEPDPQRRLRLNISNKLLEDMHPADLADIVEDLSPEDREAIFETINSEVAADALSEVEPEIQASILESLETEKAAEIVEEMAPDEAADLLAELTEEASNEILEEMDVEPESEVRELLEFREDTAGGLMNTEYVALRATASVADALAAIRGNEELLEILNVLLLLDAEERLTGVVPLAKLFLADPETPLNSLASTTPISVPVGERQKEITELFDKYNLLTLPVVGEEGKLAGVITADDVISILRKR